MMDRTEDGRKLKMLPVVDEYTRECLSIEVERSITAKDVVAILAKLFLERGEPKFIRSDNGPEFIAKAVKGWLEVSGVKTLYIEPGSPWENAYSETFNSRFRDELLDREEFITMCWKRRSWPKSTEDATTITDHTAPLATRHQRSLERCALL